MDKIRYLFIFFHKFFSIKITHVKLVYFATVLITPQKNVFIKFFYAAPAKFATVILYTYTRLAHTTRRVLRPRTRTPTPKGP